MLEIFYMEKTKKAKEMIQKLKKRDFLQTKKRKQSIKYRILRDIRNLFEHEEEDYY